MSTTMPREHKPSKLELELEKMSAAEREAFLDGLLDKQEKIVDERREWGKQTTLRTKLLVVLRAYPRANYHALALATLGDASVENRMKVTTTLKQMGDATDPLVKQVGRGLWEAVKTKKRAES